MSGIPALFSHRLARQILFAAIVCVIGGVLELACGQPVHLPHLQIYATLAQRAGGAVLYSTAPNSFWTHGLAPYQIVGFSNLTLRYDSAIKPLTQDEWASLQRIASTT